MTKAARPAPGLKRPARRATVGSLRRTRTVRSQLHDLATSGPVAATPGPTPLPDDAAQRRAGSFPGALAAGGGEGSPRGRPRPEALRFVRSAFDAERPAALRYPPRGGGGGGGDAEDDESPRSVLCRPEDDFVADVKRPAPDRVFPAPSVDEVAAALGRLESPALPSRCLGP